MRVSARCLAGARKEDRRSCWRWGGLVVRPFAVVLAVLSAAGCATTTPVYVDGPERLAAPPPAEAGYEPYPTFSAEEILPDRWLDGPHHTFVDPVVNDGFANHYLIRSDFGAFEAVGLIETERRLREIEAIAALQEMTRLQQSGKGFEQGAVDTVKAPFRYLKRVVKNPLYLILVIPSEIGAAVTVINDAGHLIASGFSEKAVKDLIGYTGAKAELANALGVDPESSNPALQAHLTPAAWNYYSGKLPLRVAEEFLPGLPIVQVSIVSGGGSLAGGIEFLNDEIGEKSEYERLRRIGLDYTDRKHFRRGMPLSSSDRETLVGYVYALDEVRDRAEILKVAATLEAEEAAWRVLRQARMLAEYHRRVEAIEAVHVVDTLIVARTRGGLAVVPMAFDHIAWTPESEALLQKAEWAGARVLEAETVEFWLLGQGTRRFFTECRERGRFVHGNALEVLVADDAGQRVSIARSGQRRIGAVLVPHGYGVSQTTVASAPATAAQSLVTAD